MATVRSLGRFKCVSKSWCGVINDPYFIKLHLARSLETHSNSTLIMMNSHKYGNQSKFYSFNFNGLNHNHQLTQLSYPNESERPEGLIFSTCNGLLCLAFAHKRNEGLYDINHCLYNPATRAYKLLPVFKFTLEAKFVERIKTLSLGYDCVSDDYKVLKLVHLARPSNWKDILDKKSLVYSLKNNSWDIIEDPPWDKYVLHSDSSIFANNSFHWLSLECKEIKCFDLFTHKFYEMSLPDNMSRNSPKLTVLQGQLCLVTYYLDIWILKDYSNNNDKCWSQLFRNLHGPLHSFDMHHHWKSHWNLVCLKDGINIILAVTQSGINGNQVQNFLICCELESETLKKIDMPDLPEDLFLRNRQPWSNHLLIPCIISNLS